eukprot:7139558-Prymnesium_polylepis.1
MTSTCTATPATRVSDASQAPLLPATRTTRASSSRDHARPIRPRLRPPTARSNVASYSRSRSMAATPPAARS